MNRAVITIVIAVIAAIIAFYIGRSTSEKPPQTNFPGAEKHEITKEEADKYIQNNQKNPQIPKIRGGAFQRAVIDKILAQPECDGIRIYYAQAEDSSATFVLMGITEKGADISKGVIAERILPCPPWCNE